MAQDFSLRLITQRASGGDPIVRERQVPGPEATIGRAPDNDIVLADLAVDPQHARLRSTAPGRVSVESLSGVPFVLGGKSMQRADVNVASGPVLEFGAYRLALSAGDENDVVVTVTREEDERHESPSVFSLRARMFGRRRLAWIFGVGIVLLCLLVPLFLSGVLSQAKIHPDQQWSSGPLSRAHAFLEDDCRSCHQKAFVAVRDNACLDCHQASEDPGQVQKALARSQDLGSPFAPRLAPEHAAHERLVKATPLPANPFKASKVLVQRAFGRPTERCANCHVEHTRPARPTPEEAQLPLPEKPTLVVVQDCEGCHSQLKMRLKDTQLIDTPNWGRHPAFRPLVTQAAGAQPKLARVALTSAPQERSGLTFPHRLHLDPRGGVARLAISLGQGAGYGAPLECQSCHRADGAGFKPIEMERDCGSCHSLAFTRAGGIVRDLPHGDVPKVIAALNAFYGGARGFETQRARPGMIRPTPLPQTGSVLRVAFSPGGACYDCHTISWTPSADGAPVQVADVHLTQRWMPRGAFDHSVAEHGAIGKTGKAGSFKCVDCHKAETSDRASDVLLPDLGKCATCHGRTTTQIAAADDANCETCHSFHVPGRATPKPGEPKLETLRWTQVTSRAGG